MNIAARSLEEKWSETRLAESLKGANLTENVVKLKSVPPARPNAQNLADLHRREAVNCQQRIADAKRQGKKDDAAFALARKTAKATYDAALLEISEAESFSRERRAEGIAEDERLFRYNNGAVETLAE